MFFCQRLFLRPFCLLIHKPAVKAIRLRYFDQLIRNRETAVFFCQQIVQPLHFTAMTSLRHKYRSNHRHPVFMTCIRYIRTWSYNQSFP